MSVLLAPIGCLRSLRIPRSPIPPRALLRALEVEGVVEAEAEGVLEAEVEAMVEAMVEAEAEAEAEEAEAMVEAVGQDALLPIPSLCTASQRLL